MSKNNNYIWIFGENHGTTANNNSYYFWKQVVNKKDGIDKYIVFEKNEKMQEVYNNFSKYEQKFVIWKNSYKHWKLYLNADMFFVTLSYKDITPTKLLFKETALKIKKPLVYLRHGTAGMKVTNYRGKSFWNNLFKFLSYNPEEPDLLTTVNNFESHQILYSEFHPRYGEFARRDEKITDKNQILWFITWREFLESNAETKIFISYIKNVLESERLKEYLVDNGLKLKLCVHQFFDEETFKDIYLHSQKGLIEIVHSKDIDVMDELVQSNVLITDYSSVAYDFTFLNRPVLLYQPDLEIYTKERKFYCEIEELEKSNITKPQKLIDAIVNEEYGINPFFRKALPENIDYEFIKENKHIDKLYNYFAVTQKNKITVLGLNFYEHNDVVNSTMSLVEELLELGYLVEVISLYRQNRRFKVPYGLNMKIIYWENIESKIEKIKYKLHSSKSNYGDLKYDSKLKLLHPYCGYYLKKLMKNIKSNTVISTRETTHLFLDKCKSEKVNNKVYLFHTPIDSKNKNYSALLEKMKNIDFEKAIFIDEADVKIYEQDFNLNLPNSKLILNPNIVENQILNPINLDSELLDENYKLKDIILDENEVEKPLFSEFKLFNLLNTNKKEKYFGLCLSSIDKYYLDDLKNIIKFGDYLKNNNIENITIDVIGTGDYAYEFLKLIADHELFGYIDYLGSNLNIIYEIKRHDFLINLSQNQNYEIQYLQGVLNYKKVFCIRNSKSENLFKDIPNTFIESYDWLCDQINNIEEISLKDLDNNYNIVKNEISKKENGEKLIKYLND